MTPVTSAPGQVIVGLDAGTTGVKAVAFGLDSPWRQVVVREYPLSQPRPGWQVQEPETITTASAGALAECVAAAGTAEVVAIAVSAAMHGLIGLDAAMRTVTPLITWADSRAREEARSLHAAGQAAELHRRTGVPVHPMSPLTKLMWFARHDPATCETTRWWIGLKDYLLWWLTGALVTELSSASATGLLDMATRSWSADHVDLAGIGRRPVATDQVDHRDAAARGRAGCPGRAARRPSGRHRCSRRAAGQPRRRCDRARRRRPVAGHQRRGARRRRPTSGRRPREAVLLCVAGHGLGGWRSGQQ